MKKYPEFDRFSRSKLAWSVAAALTFSVGAGSTALAQEAEEEATSGVAEEITVTGSRIRRDDFSNPQPTTVVGSEMLENLGIVNIGDAMAQLPSNVANNTPTATANSSFFTGSNIANLRGLNPFFGSRTLTLVDSRRHVPTNQGDGVDLNFIPSVLIDRMEVVTGGASASYGSGAIGGVTNILLDRDLDGGKVQLDYGQTAEGDGDDMHYGLAWGSPVGERGHLVLAVEGQNMDEINNCAEARSWCSQGLFELENPTWNDTNGSGSLDTPDELADWDGQPRWIRARDGRQQLMSTTGVIASAAAPGGFGYPLDPDAAYMVNSDGTDVSPFDAGYGNYLASGGTASGGDGAPTYSFTNLRSEVERQTFYAAYEHDLTEELSFFVEGSMGTVDSYIPQGSLADNGHLIAPDNYYLQQMGGAPPDVDQAWVMLDPGVFAPPFEPITPNDPDDDVPVPIGYTVGKDWSAQANTGTETSTDLMRFALGLSGRFGDSSWTWDAYYQYGESERYQAVNDNRHLNRYNYAVDVIDDPDNPGSPICRVSTDPSNTDPLADGCVPLNIFGDDPVPADAFDYAFGFLKETTTVEQSILEGVTSGELFQGFGLGGGPVMAAVGASWREESIANIAGEPGLSDAERTDYLIQFGDSFSGEVEVTEYFLELDVPITEDLDVQAAFRSSTYENTAGDGTPTPGESYEYDINTWKVNANWAATDWLTVRASHSLDIRAPNFRELYYRQQIQPGGLFGFCNNQWNTNEDTGGGTRDDCGWDLLGGATTGLEPEESTTDTIGFVLQPFDWNVRFAMDYYQIDLEDAITPASTATVMQGCFEAEDPYYCNQLEGHNDATGEPMNPLDPDFDNTQFNMDWLRPTAFNYSLYKVRGIDYSADWVGEFDFGTLSMRWIASRMIEQTVQVDATNPELERGLVGITGNSVGFLSDYAAAPDLTAQWITTWMNGPWTVATQARFVSSGVIQSTDDRQAPGQSGYDPAFEESTDRNTVPSATYWSLNGTYNFEMGGADMSVFASINNLFDKTPPMTGTGVGGSANAIHFDTLGRSYRIGLRANF